jgi:hypothetical protein
LGRQQSAWHKKVALDAQCGPFWCDSRYIEISKIIFGGLKKSKKTMDANII